jgi:carbon-monoxide dehydrogenase large subunit
VRFFGQAVAVVIGETRNQARDGAEAVIVDYEVLPAAADIKAAIAPGAPQLHPEAAGNAVFNWSIGDDKAVDAAMSKAVHKVTFELENNRLLAQLGQRLISGSAKKIADEFFSRFADVVKGSNPVTI